MKIELDAETLNIISSLTRALERLASSINATRMSGAPQAAAPVISHVAQPSDGPPR